MDNQIYIALEERVTEIEKTVEQTQQFLTDMKKEFGDKLDSIEMGIYGDPKNRIAGLVQRVEELEEYKRSAEIAVLKKQTESATHTNVWKKALEILKWVALAYLLLKGVLNVDSFTKLLEFL